MIPVRMTGEVLDYLKLLPPEPRRALKLAIKELGKERGAIKSLSDELAGFYRLRVGSNRVIFEYEIVDCVRTITCVFAGSRKWIYEVFQSQLWERKE